MNKVIVILGLISLFCSSASARSFGQNAWGKDVANGQNDGGTVDGLDSWTDLYEEYKKFAKNTTLFGGHKIKDWTPAIRQAISDGKKYIYFRPGTYHVKGDDGEPAFFDSSVWIGAGPWEWPQKGVQTTIVAYTKVNSNGTPVKSRLKGGSIETQSTIGFWFPTSFRARFIGFELKTYHDRGFSKQIPPQATVLRMQDTGTGHADPASDVKGSIFKSCTFNGSGLMKDLNNHNADGGTDIYFEGDGAIFEGLKFASNGAGITLALSANQQQKSDFIIRNMKFHTSEGDKIRIRGSKPIRVLVEGITSNDGGTILNILGGGLIDSIISKNQVGFSADPDWNSDLAALIDANDCKINNSIISFNTAHGSDGFDGNRERRHDGKYQKYKFQHDTPSHMIHVKKSCAVKGLLIKGNNLAFSKSDLIRFDTKDAKEIFVHSNLLTSPGGHAKNQLKLKDSAVAAYLEVKEQNVSFVDNEFRSYYFDKSSGQKMIRSQSALTNIEKNNQTNDASWVQVKSFEIPVNDEESPVEMQMASQWYTDKSDGTSIKAYEHLVTDIVIFEDQTIRDWTPAIKAAIKDGNTFIYFPEGTYHVKGDNKGEPAFFGGGVGADRKVKLSWYGETNEKGDYKSKIIAYTQVKDDGTPWMVRKNRNMNGEETDDQISTQTTIGFWFTSNFNARYLEFELKTYNSKGFLNDPPAMATVLRIQKLDQWRVDGGIQNTADDNDTYLKHIGIKGSGWNDKVNDDNADGGTDIYFEGRGGVFEGLDFTGKGAGITLAFPPDGPQDKDLEASIGQSAATHQGAYYGANKIVLRNLYFDNGNSDKIRFRGPVLFRGVHFSGFRTSSKASEKASAMVRILGGGFTDSLMTNFDVGKKIQLIDPKGADNCEIWRSVIAEISTSKLTLSDCKIEGIMQHEKSLFRR